MLGEEKREGGKGGGGGGKNWLVTDWYGRECSHLADRGTSFDWCLRQTSIIIFDVIHDA